MKKFVKNGSQNWGDILDKHIRNSLLPSFTPTIKIPTQAWQDISMDYIEALPKLEGKHTITLVVERLTKYSHFISLAHPFTASSIVELYFNKTMKI